MNIFITGANRGLGLEFVKQFLYQGNNVIASCRNPEKAAELEKIIGPHNIIKLDVMNLSSLKSAVEKLLINFKSIDILINNAGIIGPKNEFWSQSNSLDSDWNATLDTIKTNAIGPLFLIQGLIDKFKAGSKVVNITSGMGSIEETGGGYYAYRISKAALNMVTKNLHVDLKSRGIIFIPIHPGWVKTDMGGSGASLNISDSVGPIIKYILKSTENESGKFVGYNGAGIEW